MAGTFQLARAVRDLDPPPNVIRLIHAGEVLMLAGLDDSDLAEIGLSEVQVKQLIGDAGELLPDVRVMSQLWDMSKAGNAEWVASMRGMFDIPEEWRSVVVVSWALHSPFLPEEYLGFGPVGARVGALMLLSNLDVTVGDIQIVNQELSTQIAAGKMTSFENGAFFASSVVLGGVVGYLTMGSGVGALAKGVDWLGGKLVEVDDWVSDLAFRWLAARQLADSDSERVGAVAEQFYDEAGRLSRSSPTMAEGKRVSMLLAAYRSLLEEVETEAGAPRKVMPDVVGMRLVDAKACLRAIGFDRLHELDVFAQEDRARTAFSESRWVVQGQWPDAGEALSDSSSVGPVAVLGFARPGEKTLTHYMRKRMETFRKSL